MNSNELLQYRIGLIRDASGMEKRPDRVPHVSFFTTWKILDAGYKLTEAMRNYSIMERVVREHQEKYGFDAVLELGQRNPLRIGEAMGAASYIVDDERETINFVDGSLCAEDELELLTANPRKFFWETAMARKFPNWNESFTVDDFRKGANEFAAYMRYNMTILKIMAEEYGLPNFTATRAYKFGAEFMMQTIRGIRGLAIDMHRNPIKLRAAIDALNEHYLEPGLDNLKKLPHGGDHTACFDCSLPLISHTIMNEKSFEKFLWPDVKKILDIAMERKLSIRLFMEGSSKRFWHYLKDYPKGIITLHPETDDVFELRKALPNVAIMGGMRNWMLGRGTKRECLDHAKRLIDELGADGGYIMSQDMIGSYRIDGNSENIKAVCDFVRDYRPSGN